MVLLCSIVPHSGHRIDKDGLTFKLSQKLSLNPGIPTRWEISARMTHFPFSVNTQGVITERLLYRDFSQLRR
jgi:hypothetical protein